MVELRRAGMGLREICRALAAEQYPPRPAKPRPGAPAGERTGGGWHPTTVARILDRAGHEGA
jgi:hypothetical protein